MNLCALLDGVSYEGILAYKEVKYVTADSRKALPHTLYFCIKGGQFDGHEFAHDAVRRGAVAVVCEHSVGLDPALEIITQNTRAAYAVACKNYFERPSDKLSLLGVTGTNGKTTVTSIIKQMLEYLGKKVGLIGTIENQIGQLTYPAKHTTPDPLELHTMFFKMLNEDIEYVAMEASSHSLDQERLFGLSFDAAVFTNLTQDHLDYHGTMEKYWEAKRKLFSMAKCAVVNIDDEYGKRLPEELDIPTITCSTQDENATLYGKITEIKRDGTYFTVYYEEYERAVKFVMSGDYSVSNALSALGVVLHLGIPFDDAVLALEKCKGVKGRAEIIASNDKFTVICDYAHTPDGLVKIISAVKKYATGRVVTLFGCAGNRDRTKRAVMGRVVADLSDFIILSSDNPRNEDPMQIIEDTLVGMEHCTDNVKVIPDRYEAIKYALENAQQDDIIILAGKGHEDYQVLSFGTVYFDEHVIVDELLKGLNI